MEIIKCRTGQIVDSNSKTKDLKAEILKENNVNYMYGDTESDANACKIANVEFKPVYKGFRTKEFLLQI